MSISLLFGIFFVFAVQLVEPFETHASKKCESLDDLSCLEDAIASLDCPGNCFDELQKSLKRLQGILCPRGDEPDNCFEWVLSKVVLELLGKLCDIIRELIERYDDETFLCAALVVNIDYLNGVYTCGADGLQSDEDGDTTLSELAACYLTVQKRYQDEILQATPDADVADEITSIVKYFNHEANDNYESDDFHRCTNELKQIFRNEK